MITDGSAHGLSFDGIPVGCLSPDVRGQMVASPVLATATRPCGSASHRLPTQFAAGTRFTPPRLVDGLRDHPSIAAAAAHQPAVVGPPVSGRREPETALVVGPLAGEKRQHQFGDHCHQPVVLNRRKGFGYIRFQPQPPAPEALIDENMQRGPRQRLAAKRESTRQDGWAALRRNESAPGDRRYAHRQRPPACALLLCSSSNLNRCASMSLRNPPAGEGPPRLQPPPRVDSLEPFPLRTLSPLRFPDPHPFLGLHRCFLVSAHPRPIRHQPDGLILEATKPFGRAHCPPRRSTKGGPILYRRHQRAPSAPRRLPGLASIPAGNDELTNQPTSHLQIVHHALLTGETQCTYCR